MNTIYGYARVSTKDQNEGRQRVALIAAGVPEANIIVDKQSGKDFERPGYQKLIRRIRTGDLLYIQSIDRLGRNYHEILDEWRRIVKKGVNIVVIDMPLLNTGYEADLTRQLISDFVLQLLSYVAETERTFIRQRQAEGILAAKEAGIRFGRRPKERPCEFDKYRLMWKNGMISSRKAGKALGVSHSTFIRWVKTCNE